MLKQIKWLNNYVLRLKIEKKFVKILIKYLQNTTQKKHKMHLKKLKNIIKWSMII